MYVLDIVGSTTIKTYKCLICACIHLTVTNSNAAITSSVMEACPGTEVTITCSLRIPESPNDVLVWRVGTSTLSIRQLFSQMDQLPIIRELRDATGNRYRIVVSSISQMMVLSTVSFNATRQHGESLTWTCNTGVEVEMTTIRIVQAGNNNTSNTQSARFILALRMELLALIKALHTIH